MNLHEAEKFLSQRASGSESEAEREAFEQWLETASENELEELTGKWDLTGNGRAMPGREEFFAELENKLNELESDTIPEVVHLPVWRRPVFRYGVAAAVLLAFAGAGILKFNSNQHSSDHIAADVIIPESPAAGVILTIGNGTTLMLDSANAGQLAVFGGADIVKQADGTLAYRAGAESAAGEVVYNTLATPRGRQYVLSLPDGSKVHLNAASSVRFPSVFSGKDRTVELEGEAFFEIAANPSKPFRVKVQNAVVDVLGTSFNLMAYPEEGRIATTLLEGSVKYSGNGNEAILKPGQQANDLTGRRSSFKVLNKVDTDEVIAWKKGLFTFHNADIGQVARQIARWYDVEIDLRVPVTAHITGEFPNSMELKEVMKVLELSGLKTKLEGRVLQIMSK